MIICGIRNWAISIPNMYAAPEIQGRPTIVGVLNQEWKGYAEGKPIHTSGVIRYIERTAVTRGGSVYVLVGKPHPQWIMDMERQNLEIDLTDPFKYWRNS